MFHSAEIRWFLPGEADSSVAEWFERSDMATEEEPRIDTYLLLPGCISVGVKIRQGHLEIKALTSAPEAVSYANGISGKRASWVKWSSGIAGASLLTERKGPEQWVQVEKSRTLRLFAAERGIVTEKQPGIMIPGPGCQLELARLRLLPEGDNWDEAESWWSMCFEAFGERPSDTLNFVASHEPFRALAEVLPGASSMSYPDWFCHAGPVE
jgi:hypothetical protein